MSELSTILPYIPACILGVLVLWFGLSLFSGIFTVPEKTEYVIERFGKYNRTVTPGLHLKIPFFGIEQIRSTLDLRMQQLSLDLQPKTKDDVYIDVTVAINLLVRNSKDATYNLADRDQQIEAFVNNVVRAEVAKMDLNEVFSNMNQISEAVKYHLSVDMSNYGYEIISTPITHLAPNKQVQAAQNEIQTQQRLKEARKEQAEADYITQVRNAEGAAEVARLHGEGIAKERLAIARGMEESILAFGQVGGLTEDQVLATIMLSLYLDSIKAIGQSTNSTTIFLPGSPDGMTDFTNQIRNVIMSAQRVPPATPPASTSPEQTS